MIEALYIKVPPRVGLVDYNRLAGLWVRLRTHVKMNTSNELETNQVNIITSPEDKLRVENTASHADKTIAETITEGNEKTITMRGGLSEILQRAIDILYDKKADYGKNMSLENLDNGKVNYAVLTVVKGNVTEEDLALMTKLLSTDEYTRIALLIIEPDDAVESPQMASRLNVLETLANANNIPTFTSLSELIKVSNVNKVEEEDPVIDVEVEEDLQDDKDLVLDVGTGEVYDKNRLIEQEEEVTSDAVDEVSEETEEKEE